MSLMETLERKENYKSIPNLCYPVDGDGKKIICNPIGDLIADLDSLPFPDKPITLKEVPYYDDIYYTITERGCVKNCTFCFTHVLRGLYLGKGEWFRRRSVKNVIEELIIAKNQKYYPRLGV